MKDGTEGGASLRAPRCIRDRTGGIFFFALRCVALRCVAFLSFACSLEGAAYVSFPNNIHLFSMASPPEAITRCPRTSSLLLNIVHARTTRVNLTVPALKDPPVRAGMAHVAGPLDECVVRLDHLEGVGTAVGDGHDEDRHLLSACIGRDSVPNDRC
jgi:hypothetical protein